MLDFERINDDIFLLKVPFSIVWTGVILVIDRENNKRYLIDSSNDDPDKYIVPALKNMDIEPESIDYLLNTHCHGDHIGGHSKFVQKYNVKIATYSEGYERLQHPANNAIRIRTRFPQNSPKPQAWLEGVNADVMIENHEILGGRLMLVHTPGHDDDCVCWYDLPTKTIITGDSVQANGTPTQGIGFYQSLNDYLYTLDTLDGMDIETMVAGHDYAGIGSVIMGKDAVKKAINICRDYVQKYDEFIKDRLKHGLDDITKIAEELIADMGCGTPKYLFLALYTVSEHIKRIKEMR